MVPHLLLLAGLLGELGLLGVARAGAEVSEGEVQAETHVDAPLRERRAPGWGKRAQGTMAAFDAESMSDDLLTAGDEETEKRAPGWGKRAPGWGKRAPGWGKRAPGWGKRAPGWGKRAPGWGKRAPGWGKRDSVGADLADSEDSDSLLDAADKRAPGWGKRAPGWGKRAPGWGKRAPGWGKRAPGWGKRAPGWGKRAPGWGKRSSDTELKVCEAVEDEIAFYMQKVIQAEAKLQQYCGGEMDANDIQRK